MRGEQRQLRFDRRNQEAHALLPADRQKHVEIVVGISERHDETFVGDLQSGSIWAGITRKHPATVV